MSDLGIGPLVQTAGSRLQTDQSGASWLDSSWWEQLQPGSWRGVGFVMDAAETHAGRRTVPHEYPYRDTVWIEDLGRLPRRFAFQAFLDGDDVYQQRNAMIRACETAGAGTLVHPTFGSVECVLVDFSTTDRRERGRLVEIAFQFIVAGELTFPQSQTATGEAVDAAASGLDAASTSDLGRSLADVSIVPAVSVSSISGYATTAVNLVDDATRSLNAVAGLSGYYGRYSSGRRGTLLPIGSTVASALSASITTRQAVLDAADTLNGAAGAL
jgi:prophage DNA circulation protein